MHDLTVPGSLTTYRVAEIVGIRHRDAYSTAVKYLDDLRRYGPMEVRINVKESGHPGAPRRYYELSPAQFAFLLSRCRSTHISSLIADFVSSLPKAHADALLSLVASMDVEDLPPDRFVYVAVEEGTGNYKVGISVDPERRVRELSIGNPRELSLVKVFKALPDGYLSETLAHAALAEHHIRSEWFGPRADVRLVSRFETEKLENN